MTVLWVRVHCRWDAGATLTLNLLGLVDAIDVWMPICLNKYFSEKLCFVLGGYASATVYTKGVRGWKKVENPWYRETDTLSRDMTTCWDFYPMQLLKEATWRRICLHLLSRWMYWLICESSRWPNDRVGVVFILALFNNTVVKILAHDKGCETPLSLLDS